MNNKLVKIGTGAATFISALYWGVLPALAVGFCPVGAGYNAPGCGTDFKVETAIGSVVGILFFIAFIIALMFLIYGGIKWILSSGDKDAASHAKDAVTNALVGLAIVLASYVLINIVLQLILGTNLSNLNVPSLSTGTKTP